MEKICGIYKITSPSGKIYIGQSNNILYRWKYHYYTLNCKRQRHLYNSLVKYGVDKHLFEIICTCSLEECNDLEQYHVKLYNSFDSNIGLNLREGGGNKTKFSKESKEKMRINAIGNTNMLGKFHSIETKIKMSTARKGSKMSDETKQKIAKTRIGKKHSDDTINKLIIAKQKNKFTKKIINTKTKQIYNSVEEAALSINKTATALSIHFTRGTNIKFNLEYYDKG